MPLMSSLFLGIRFFGKYRKTKLLALENLLKKRKNFYRF